MDVFDEMIARWPSSIVARTEIHKFTGGAISHRTFANLDCQGKGPPGRFYMGRKVVYPIRTLVLWLREYMKMPKGRGAK